MYPFIRMFKNLWIHRKDPALPLTGTHISHHICWPWDIDLWMELNNGRTLTLYDLGRIPLAHRTGLIAALRRRRWGLTVAGSSVRYRRRIRTFEKFEMRSRALCADGRFMYLEQSMWKQSGECANHALYRTAVTGPGGIVPPTEVIAELGHIGALPDIPPFVQAWIDAETARPWPPMQDTKTIS